jgi:hypothetical protein
MNDLVGERWGVVRRAAECKCWLQDVSVSFSCCIGLIAAALSASQDQRMFVVKAPEGVAELRPRRSGKGEVLAARHYAFLPHLELAQISQRQLVSLGLQKP